MNPFEIFILNSVDSTINKSSDIFTCADIDLFLLPDINPSNSRRRSDLPSTKKKTFKMITKRTIFYSYFAVPVDLNKHFLHNLFMYMLHILVVVFGFHVTIVFWPCFYSCKCNCCGTLYLNAMFHFWLRKI